MASEIIYSVMIRNHDMLVELSAYHNRAKAEEYVRNYRTDEGIFASVITVVTED